MLNNIANPPVDDDASGPEILGPRRHEAAPAGRVQALGLLDVHDLAGLVAVGKVLGRLRRGRVAGLDHLDGHSRADDPPWRSHPEAVEEAPVRVAKLDEGISDLQFYQDLMKTKAGVAYIAAGELGQPADKCVGGHRGSCDGNVKWW